MASVPESGISVDSPPQVTCVIAFSKGFICSGGAGTVHLFEKTDDKDIYKKAREIKIPLDSQSPDLQNLESQEIMNLTVSPSEETLVCSTKSSQLYCITMSTADLGKVGNATLQQPAKVLSRCYCDSNCTSGLHCRALQPMTLQCNTDNWTCAKQPIPV